MEDDRTLGEIEARKNTLKERAVKWMNDHPTSSIVIGTVVGGLVIITGVMVTSIKVERSHTEWENRIKESSIIYREVPIQVQRYWGADTNGDGEVDTIMTDSVRNLPLHTRGNYGNSRAYAIEKGDKGFDAFYEIISQPDKDAEILGVEDE